MALDTATIYATYEDDGALGPGAQSDNTFPAKALLIFKNMPLAKEYELALRTYCTGRKNPRITGFYSQDADEVLLSCHLARVVQPIRGFALEENMDNEEIYNQLKAEGADIGEADIDKTNVSLWYPKYSAFNHIFIKERGSTSIVRHNGRGSIEISRSDATELFGLHEKLDKMLD